MNLMNKYFLQEQAGQEEGFSRPIIIMKAEEKWKETYKDFFSQDVIKNKLSSSFGNVYKPHLCVHFTMPNTACAFSGDR